MKAGEKIKAARKRAGLTQQECGDVLGTSKEWVSKVERDLSTPLEITVEGALARLSKLKRNGGAAAMTNDGT